MLLDGSVDLAMLNYVKWVGGTRQILRCCDLLNPHNTAQMTSVIAFNIFGCQKFRDREHRWLFVIKAWLAIWMSYTNMLALVKKKKAVIVSLSKIKVSYSRVQRYRPPHSCYVGGWGSWNLPLSQWCQEHLLTSQAKLLLLKTFIATIHEEKLRRNILIIGMYKCYLCLANRSFVFSAALWRAHRRVSQSPNSNFVPVLRQPLVWLSGHILSSWWQRLHLFTT